MSVVLGAATVMTTGAAVTVTVTGLVVIGVDERNAGVDEDATGVGVTVDVEDDGRDAGDADDAIGAAADSDVD